MTTPLLFQIILRCFRLIVSDGACDSISGILYLLKWYLVLSFGQGKISLWWCCGVCGNTCPWLWSCFVLCLATAWYTTSTLHDFFAKYFGLLFFFGRSGLVCFSFAFRDLEGGKRYTSASIWALLFFFISLLSIFLHTCSTVFHTLIFFSCIWVGWHDAHYFLATGPVADWSGLLRENPWIGCGVDWCLLGVAC